ncbi:hypothetical protein [Streptomyces sp. NPDC001401]|uniref:hypothetical protein n=1 Tax=Streptomyces sp. NPDC001401 TaxID=3364570 RepID=UPI00367FBE4E
MPYRNSEVSGPSWTAAPSTRRSRCPSAGYRCAAEDIWDYDEERVRAVFRTPATDLPEGELVEGISSDTPLLVFEDPAGR